MGPLERGEVRGELETERARKQQDRAEPGGSECRAPSWCLSGAALASLEPTEEKHSYSSPAFLLLTQSAPQMLSVMSHEGIRNQYRGAASSPLPSRENSLLLIPTSHPRADRELPPQNPAGHRPGKDSDFPFRRKVHTSS